MCFICHLSMSMHDNSNAIGEPDEMKKKTLKVPFISLLNNDNRIFHHIS